ncbi:PTS sugar transporter subunit IIA [Anaerococcus urinomassiliensis]|uniref:PTS sugar transporter subunit IIA n=1 Tax=Anaerococcus urinomassiliensis TaxID=1745712 RepID=UPI00093C406F|nr:PTS sugar transporter subunit IIA [Anaerococcus urinomassiliensis]
MKGIILTTHGNFASGLYSTIKMIAGEFENIKIVEFHEGDNLEDLDKRLVEAYDSLDYDQVVVLTDLAGGTPFNRSVMSLSDKGNVGFLAGVNFAMLYQALSSETENLDEFIEEVLETSKESITKFDLEVSQEDDDLDGI